MGSRRRKSTRPGLTAESVPAQPVFAGLDELLGYRLRRAQGAVHREYLAAQADLDPKLTQKQTAVMWLVQCNPGVAQGAISNMLGMDAATMMELVNRLVARGLLLRKRSRIDARRRELHATAAGQHVIDELRGRISKHEARMRHLFSATELHTLEKLLQRLQSLESRTKRRSSG